MRRLVFTLLAAILLLVLSATGMFLALSPRRVVVEVRDELDKKPVPHAVVVVADRSVYRAYSGNYELDWLFRTVTVTVHADGYLPTHAGVPEGRSVGEPVRMDVFISPNTLSGTVYDAETRAALADASVFVGNQVLRVDREGRYQVCRVRTGSLLGASAVGYQDQAAVFSGQTEQDFFLPPTETRVVVRDSYTDKPVSNVLIACNLAQSRTDEEGMTVLKRLAKGSALSVEAPGYESQSLVHQGESSLVVMLRPNTLQGVIKDRDSGAPLPEATVRAFADGQVVALASSDMNGYYSLGNLPPLITVTVTAPEYEPFRAAPKGTTELNVELRRFHVRGIYLPLGLLTSERRVFELLDLVDSTELNAIVVDMKNDRGWLAYPSAVPETRRSRAYQPEVMNVQRFLQLCRERDIYVIARVVLFKDPMLVAAYPEWAVLAGSGSSENEGDAEGKPKLYVDAEGSTWLDPFRKEVQDYLVAIAKEVAGLGFDELQFDYIRFPSDGHAGKARYSQKSTLESRTRTIREFCARLRRELEPYGVILSADLFGLTVWVAPEHDMGIGQRVIDIAPYMDYLSPMLYPATFTSGNLGYDDPRLYPYEVVYRSCVELSKRTTTRIRPWLQHYSWKDVSYGTKELRLQKKAAEDAGTYGWMFWHAAGRYDAAAFDVPEASE